MYRIALQLVDENWSTPSDAADALGVLLLTWNQASYRYSLFDFANLEGFIRDSSRSLDAIRRRRLGDGLTPTDLELVKALFAKLLDSLRTEKGSRSPVGAGKALHALAPAFLPIWDDAIAKAYGCRWYGASQAPDRYVEFVQANFAILMSLAKEKDLDAIEEELNASARFPKSVLKYIDEFNYAVFTRGWIAESDG